MARAFPSLLGTLIISACASVGSEVPTPPDHASPSPAARVFLLRMRATDAYNKGDFKTCTALLAEAAPLRARPSGRAAAGRARCLAAGGNADDAMDNLHEAVRLQYHDCDTLRGDADFAALRSRPDWPPLIATCAV